MVNKKDTILTILKAIEATMSEAGLSLSSPKNPEEEDGDIKYSGDNKDVILRKENDILSIICVKGVEEKVVSKVYFDYDAEDWNNKDTKYVANEICESVAGFFGTKLVLDSSDSKKNDKQSKADKKEETPAQKKKAKKESVVTYEAINLANRMENIYPQIKGKMDEHMDKYDLFIEEDYFQEIVTPLVVETIKNEDRPVMKKIFNAFNIFYEEAEKDVQSLVAVSILGVNFAKDPSLFEKSESYMEENLLGAIKPIMDYLRSPAGKRKLKAFDNPKIK